MLRLAGTFLVAGVLSGCVVGCVDALVPLPPAWRLALAGALGYVSGRWLGWLAARNEGRSGWRDWPEYRTALKRDEARRKAVRSRRP